MTIKCKVAIIIPKPDSAAQNIWLYLKEGSFFKQSEEIFDDSPVFVLNNNPQVNLFHSVKDGVHSDHLDESINAELFIFASRHRAASGTPALLIHTTGNWAEVTLGGREKELAYNSAYAIKQGFRSLQEKQEEYKLEEFKVDLEVTHHGPTNLQTPLCFMELGSSEEFWKHKKGATAVAEAILQTAKIFVKNNSTFSGIPHVGFGGNHYAYRFHKQLVANEETYIGHMAPKHSLDKLSKEIIAEAFEKTKEQPEIAMIDKKGTTSPQRKKIIEIVEELGKEYLIV